MGKSDPEVKSFDISKRLVWEAYKSVKANDGAAGVDGVSIEEFETDLKNNLYRIWNRMSSGTYFPPPVRAVEIPKQHREEREFSEFPLLETESLKQWWRCNPVWSRSFTTTRTGTGVRGAERRWKCRERCWKKDWILDLDVQKFFDSVDMILWSRRWRPTSRTRSGGSRCT